MPDCWSAVGRRLMAAALGRAASAACRSGVRVLAVVVERARWWPAWPPAGDGRRRSSPSRPDDADATRSTATGRPGTRAFEHALAVPCRTS